MTCKITITVLLVVISILHNEQVDSVSWDCGSLSTPSSLLVDGAMDVNADMRGLNVGQECEILLKRLYDNFELKIEVNTTDQDKSCGVNSNQLTLSRRNNDLTNQFEPMLLCGTTMIEKMLVTSTVKVVFSKVSTNSKLQQFRLRLDPRYSNRLTWRFGISLEPRLLSYYPIQYGEDPVVTTQIKTNGNDGIFFRLRFIESKVLRTCGGFPDNSPWFLAKLCNGALRFYNPVDHDDDLNLYHFANPSSYGGSFELEYQGIKKEPPYYCSNNAKQKNITVKEASYFSYSLTWHIDYCRMVLTADNPDKILKISNTTSMLSWASASQLYEFQIFVGDMEIKRDNASNSILGAIQGRKGQSITISWKYTRPGQFYTSLLIGFVVELIDADNPPVDFTAFTTPTHVWIPSEQDFGINVRSVTDESCVQFTAFDEDMTEIDDLVQFASLYTGSEGTNGFELTKDCFGDTISSATINNYISRTTYVKPKTQSLSRNGSNSRLKGFWLKFVMNNSTCGAIETQLSSPGQNSSDIFDRVEIKKYMSCIFVISPESQGIQFKGNLQKLIGAKLTVNEGQTPPNTLADFSLLKTDHLWFYSSKTLIIHFQTQALISDDMVSFEYKAWYNDGNNLACPGPRSIFVYDSEIISTPQWPNHLQSKMDCIWILKRPYYEVTKVLHVTVDKSSMIPCSSSTQLYIYEEKEKESFQTPVCGSADHYSVFSGNTIKVSLQGGADKVVKGIKINAVLKELDYHKACNKTYPTLSTGVSTEIVGTLKPGQFIIPFVCLMHFSASPETFLTIHLKSVDIRGSYGCMLNSLEVYDGPSTLDLQLIKLCYTTERMVTTKDNHVTLRIAILGSSSLKTQRFNVTIQPTLKGARKCSSVPVELEASSFTRTISSPNYPSQYFANLNCQWIITSNEANIEIEIISLDLEWSSRCYSDILEIYDGPNSRYELLADFCGSLARKAKYRGTGKSLFIRFKTNSFFQKKGFSLKYETRDVPSSDLVNYDQFRDDYNSNEESSNNQTGVIVGICLASIVGIFGITAVIGLILHKKRARDIQRQRTRRPPLNIHFNNSSQDSVFVINPVILNNAAPPPPYPGIDNQGFTEELPPSYTESFQYLVTPTPPAMDSAFPPPPPYSLSQPLGQEASSNERNDMEGIYDRRQDNDNQSSSPVYQTLEQSRPNNMTGPDRNWNRSNLNSDPVPVPSSVYSLTSRSQSRSHCNSESEEQASNTSPNNAEGEDVIPPPSYNPNHNYNNAGMDHSRISVSEYHTPEERDYEVLMDTSHTNTYNAASSLPRGSDYARPDYDYLDSQLVDNSATNETNEYDNHAFQDSSSASAVRENNRTANFNPDSNHYTSSEPLYSLANMQENHQVTHTQLESPGRIERDQTWNNVGPL